MVFLPGISRIFTGCFASCLAAYGRLARKRQLCQAVWFVKQQQKYSLFFVSRSFCSLGPGLKALVQGRTADDRLWRIFFGCEISRNEQCPFYTVLRRLRLRISEAQAPVLFHHVTTYPLLTALISFPFNYYIFLLDDPRRV